MKISNRIKTIAAGTASVLGAGLNAGIAMAADKTVVFCPNGKPSTTGDLQGCKSGENGINSEANKGGLIDTVGGIISVVIGVLGFVAVIVIILGGVQYTTSAGDANKVKKAKDTILYGIIGLVVALLAYAIINFVLSSIVGK